MGDCGCSVEERAEVGSGGCLPVTASAIASPFHGVLPSSVSFWSRNSLSRTRRACASGVRTSVRRIAAARRESISPNTVLIIEFTTAGSRYCAITRESVPVSRASSESAGTGCGVRGALQSVWPSERACTWTRSLMIATSLAWISFRCSR